MKKADVAGGNRSGVTVTEAAELRDRQEADPAARAGDRGPASCRCLPVPGEPAGKIVFPLVGEMARAGTRVRVPVVAACRVLGRSTQGYYQWATDPVCQRDWDDAHLIHAAREIHHEIPVSATATFATSSLSRASSPASAHGSSPHCRHFVKDQEPIGGCRTALLPG